MIGWVVEWCPGADRDGIVTVLVVHTVRLLVFDGVNESVTTTEDCNL